MEGLTGDPRAAFLKHSSQYSLALGEEGQAVFADALLVTDNEETAGQVLAIIQGLKALVGLTTQDPNAIKLAQGLSVSQQGSQVVLSLRLASSEVVEALREGIEQKNQ